MCGVPSDHKLHGHRGAHPQPQESQKPSVPEGESALLCLGVGICFVRSRLVISKNSSLATSIHFKDQVPACRTDMIENCQFWPQVISLFPPCQVAPATPSTLLGSDLGPFVCLCAAVSKLHPAILQDSVTLGRPCAILPP